MLEMIHRGVFGAISGFLSSMSKQPYDFEQKRAEETGMLGNQLAEDSRLLKEALDDLEIAANPYEKLQICSGRIEPSIQIVSRRAINRLIELFMAVLLRFHRFLGPWVFHSFGVGSVFAYKAG